MEHYKTCTDNYSHYYRRQRSKSDWAGVGLGDAFKPNLDYHLRLPAQRMFYQTVKKVQKAVARHIGITVEEGFVPRVKPQLTPCYSNYPSAIAVYAAIGLTGYLEFKAWSSANIMIARMANYLGNPAAFDEVRADPQTYKALCFNVVESVQTRLLLEDLSRFTKDPYIEIYRCFACSQETLKFGTVSEIIRAVILYGDLLPDWRRQLLHLTTRALLRDLIGESLEYIRKLPDTPSHELIHLGERWVKAVCRRLAKYLPDKTKKDPVSPEDEDFSEYDKPTEGATTIGDPSHGSEATKPWASQLPEIAPLNGTRPPMLSTPSNTKEHFACDALNETLFDSLRDGGKPAPGESEETKRVKKSFNDFINAIEKAGGQSNHEDMRSDLVEQFFSRSAFTEGPIQGNPTDGHSVPVPLGKDRNASGEIFDRPVELSDDLIAYEKLLHESQPITDALRKTLYPNVMEIPDMERFRASGSLDPSRLVLADFATAVFRRYRMNEEADRRGRPVLLIACDGSGSLNADQMRMLKILTAAWLNSTARGNIQVLAGLYHSGVIRQGMLGPLVQWMYHPRKTPAISRRDAVRSLIALPDIGTGVQSDALSIAFMLKEAIQIARGWMIYLILITDCEWNKCFRSNQSGKEEVYSYLQTVYKELPHRIHTTLVGLGVSSETGFEDLLDKVVTVSDAELKDPASVAGKIGTYVASCMRERQRLLSR